MNHQRETKSCLIWIFTCLCLSVSFCDELDGAQGQAWVVDSQEQWETNKASATELTIEKGQASPNGKNAVFKSKLKRYEEKRSANNIEIRQSMRWLNWEPIENIGPSNLWDAPVMLSLGPGNYWIFGRFRNPAPAKRGDNSKPETFEPKPATLEGFDVPLETTPFPNQFNATGGLKKQLGGYHAWQSKDMVNWVHHGAITNKKSCWMTTAEYAEGKAYFYYDFPNDQDPHVYVDEDLFDGLPGINKGIAYDDPTHGSDCAIIRDLDGNFHLILEDWSPINAREHSWDSPLAVHAVSSNGVDGFKVMAPPVDHRTEPTGKIDSYKHPHWVKENPERFKTNVAEFEIHEPAQNAYGDWAAISIGGHYYLFCDYDPADKESMSVGWFHSSSIDEPFQWCGNIGQGHPDPDIMFAEGKFYLATQQSQDFKSPGPWVEEVKVRVGVDTNNDQLSDHWSDWTTVKETYDHLQGFSKQIAKTPARLDLSELPHGYGFQFELKLSDTTDNASKPVISFVQLTFD